MKSFLVMATSLPFAAQQQKEKTTPQRTSFLVKILNLLDTIHTCRRIFCLFGFIGFVHFALMLLHLQHTTTTAKTTTTTGYSNSFIQELANNANYALSLVLSEDENHQGPSKRTRESQQFDELFSVPTPESHPLLRKRFELFSVPPPDTPLLLKKKKPKTVNTIGDVAHEQQEEDEKISTNSTSGSNNAFFVELITYSDFHCNHSMELDRINATMDATAANGTTPVMFVPEIPPKSVQVRGDGLVTLHPFLQNGTAENAGVYPDTILQAQGCIALRTTTSSSLSERKPLQFALYASSTATHTNTTKTEDDLSSTEQQLPALPMESSQGNSSAFTENEMEWD